MAERSFAAICGIDQGARRRGGDFDTPSASRNHFALERGVHGGRLPAVPRQDYGLRGVFALDATAKSGSLRKMGLETGGSRCKDVPCRCIDGI